MVLLLLVACAPSRPTPTTTPRSIPPTPTTAPTEEAVPACTSGPSEVITATGLSVDENREQLGISAVIDSSGETVPMTLLKCSDEQPIQHLSRRTGIVDEEVWFTKEDVVSGADTVREYAIQLIREARTEAE
jgi:hypothetical protein